MRCTQTIAEPLSAEWVIIYVVTQRKSLMRRIQKAGAGLSAGVWHVQNLLLVARAPHTRVDFRWDHPWILAKLRYVLTFDIRLLLDDWKITATRAQLCKTPGIATTAQLTWTCMQQYSLHRMYSSSLTPVSLLPVLMM